MSRGDKGNEWIEWAPARRASESVGFRNAVRFPCFVRLRYPSARSCESGYKRWILYRGKNVCRGKRESRSAFKKCSDGGPLDYLVMSSLPLPLLSTVHDITQSDKVHPRGSNTGRQPGRNKSEGFRSRSSSNQMSVSVTRPEEVQQAMLKDNDVPGGHFV
jgi:hypothetical protein